MGNLNILFIQLIQINVLKASSIPYGANVNESLLFGQSGNLAQMGATSAMCQEAAYLSSLTFGRASYKE